MVGVDTGHGFKVFNSRLFSLCALRICGRKLNMKYYWHIAA